MERYFFEISFDGTGYSGWQRQKTAITVQQTIEDKLAILLQREIRIHGCGRTDAGVHARQYFFHLDLDKDPVTIAFKLNNMLPKDIAILGFANVGQKENAQKDARLRTYEYQITSSKNPFMHPFQAFTLEVMDVKKIESALAKIIGTHDFQNFCKRPEIMDNTKCTIKAATVTLDQKTSTIKILVSGNRFLHHMMRLLVGNLIKVGKGLLSVEEFKDYIDLKASPKHFELAPAQGLVLSKVEYDGVVD